MEETKIKILTNISLPDVVSYIKQGKWKIPRFQREFVWEKKKVIELLDSMYRGFPIGSFFLWIPPEEYSKYYKDIPELQIEQVTYKYYTHFILDGQQRLTSLYVTSKGLTVNGFNYSQICFDLDTEKFNTDLENGERNISVSKILNYEECRELYDSLTNDRKKIFMRLRDRFHAYPLPIITIEDKNIEDACKVFERINQGGKRLSIFDLVVAVTWDKDFELKKKIDEFNEKIKESFGKIDYEVFSEALSLIINKQCTKAFQLKLTSEAVKEKWDDVVKAMGLSIQFLRTHLKVRSYKYLPYRDILALITYYFYNCESLDINKKFLEEWFWKVSFSNRYSGSSLTKMGEDRAYLFDRVLEKDEVNITYGISLNEERIMNINMGRDTALRNALILILIQQNPLSFFDTTPIDIEKDFISNFNNSEKHHIFPKKFLKSIGVKEKKMTDLVVNFCLIDSKLNKDISGNSPLDYFSKYKKKNLKLKEALNSHLIPSDGDSAIWKNNYAEFIKQRAKIILRQVKKKIGDFTATLEEEMASDPGKLIKRLEQNLREIVNKTLYGALGENWWETDEIVPQDVKEYAKNQIKKEKANKPYISEEEWKLPVRLLEQINVMDIPKIISRNWNHFEDIFGSKKMLERSFDGFATIRNQVDHLKTMDQTERKFGETSIEWLFRCINKDDEKDAESGPVSFLYVNELYEELKKNILELDPESKEKKLKNYNAFSKYGYNFVATKFRDNGLKIEIPIDKKSFKDEKNLVKMYKRKEDKRIRWGYFTINSKNELSYAMDLINQSRILIEEKCPRTEESHLEKINPKISAIYFKFKEYMKKLDPKIKFNPQSYYISIRKNRNFAYLYVRKEKISLIIMLPYEEYSRKIVNHEVKTLPKGTKNWYNGPSFEIVIENDSNLEEVLNLLEEAYRKQE